MVEAEHVGKVLAPDVTAHLFQCLHHYRITDLHLRLFISSQVVSKQNQQRTEAVEVVHPHRPTDPQVPYFWA